MQKIGLVLTSLSGDYETFITTKINILIAQGFKLSLFVGSNRNCNNISYSIPIYYQVDINNKILLLFNLITTFALNPIRCTKLLSLERASHYSWFHAFKSLLINSHIIRRKLDWLHFEFSTTAIGRENVAKAMGAKLAISFRGFDIGLYPYQHPNCYNLLWKQVYKVHTISEALYRQALVCGLKKHIPIEKIYPSVDTNFFNNVNMKAFHEPLRILTVGRLKWVKGYEYCLNALKILKGENIQFEYKIIGDGNYHEAITYAIYQLGLNNDVTLEGKITQIELKEHYIWADIYIQPSIHEGFCNSVLEAQAMGLPCIVTNTGGLPENVIHGKTGWVINKRSAKSIANEIMIAKGVDFNKLIEIKKNAAERVKKKFNLSEHNRKWVEFYTK